MLCLALLAITATANAISTKEKLSIVPAPMQNFNERASMGRWFVQCRIAGCGYASSDQISDYVQVIYRQGPGYISSDTWRNDICNTISSTIIRESPGVYTIKDPIGAIWSGRMIIPAINTKRYKVVWGCTKMSITGEACDDPYLQVYTRHPRPRRKTLSHLNNVLRRVFHITITELQRVRHTNPCNDGNMMCGGDIMGKGKGMMSGGGGKKMGNSFGGYDMMGTSFDNDDNMIGGPFGGSFRN